MISKPQLALALLLAAAAALAGCNPFGGNDQKQAAGLAGPRKPPQVGFIALKSTSAPIVENVAGRTVASAVAEIRPQVSGIIERRVFAEGSRVTAGEVLYQIDARTYQAAVDSANAALESAEAAVPSAQAKFGRYQELAKVNGVSKQDVDEARSALLQAKASVAAAESALRTAQINLDYTKVTAPISGLIGTSAVTQGALVTADQTTALATIRQIDPIYLDLTASSTALMRLRSMISALPGGEAGARVKLSLSDGGIYKETGRVISTEAAVSQTTDTVTIRSSFANPDSLLLPGMYVRASVELGVEDNIFLLPQRAVSRTVEGEATAFFVTDDGKAESRTVNAVRAYGNSWVVKGGLKDGDRLVVDGLQKIRSGMAVEPLAVELGEDGLVKPVSAKAP